VFNWTHQRDLIAKELKKRKLDYAVIDGSVKDEDRTAAVKQFQDGKLRAMLIHPQSAGHGITLTRGVATIWASPTFNAEHWVQANGRVRRAGQTKRTEVIKIAASGTREEQVYERLEGKLEGMDALMTLLGD
jgi:SNF2 family DNA or RNA helicase